MTPHKGLLLVGLPGVGKDLTKRIASSVLGRPLLDLDFGTLMGAGGGVLGSAERAIREALGRVELVRGILGLSEYEKATAGLGSSDRTESQALPWCRAREGRCDDGRRLLLHLGPHVAVGRERRRRVLTPPKLPPGYSAGSMTRL